MIMENMDELFDPDVEEKQTESSDGSIWVWKGKNDPIKVEVSKFKDKYYLNVREWYLPKDAQDTPENYRPTKKGVSVNIETARELINAMNTVLSSVLIED